MTLSNGSEFTCDEEVDAAYRIISQNAKQIGEQLNSWFKVVEKLHQDVILGFDWLQSVNQQVNWVNCSITLKNGFVAAGVLIHHNIKIELFSFKVLIYLLQANKGTDSQFTFVQLI